MAFAKGGARSTSGEGDKGIRRPPRIAMEGGRSTAGEGDEGMQGPSRRGSESSSKKPALFRVGFTLGGGGCDTQASGKVDGIASLSFRAPGVSSIVPLFDALSLFAVFVLATVGIAIGSPCGTP